MYNKKSQMCQLKNKYDPFENIIPCTDCVMYDVSGERYVYQKPGTPTPSNSSSPSSRGGVHAQASPATVGSPTTGIYLGSGAGYKKIDPKKRLAWRSSCTFDFGYEEHKKYDLPGMPILTSNAFECCAACFENEGTLNAPSLF